MESWGTLGINVAVVGLFVSFWANIASICERRPRLLRSVAFGTLMGVAAMASMLNAIEFRPGIYLDLRVAVLCIAGLFGGPVAALVAVVLSGALRLYMGGAGVAGGIAFMALAAGLGAAGWAVLPRPPRVRHILLISLLAVLLALAATILSANTGPDPMPGVAIPVALMTALTTLGIGLVLLRTQDAASERDLLRAALMQGPDYIYFKDRHSRIVAANRRVAEVNGFSDPAMLIGLSDRDLTSPERAEKLLAQEAQIMQSGEPQTDIEETLSVKGEDRIFSTTKVPLRNFDGVVIGIAGVTRDITDQHRLTEDVREGRDLLDTVTAQMSDGLALFDADGTLRYCNELYRSMFPITGDMRRPGVNVRDMLQRVVDTGEQMNLPDDKQAWIDGVVSGMGEGSEEQVRFCDGTWLQLRSRPTPRGETIVVATDITEMKRTEAELLSLTAQLQVLATTDGLTDLLNRRSFDTAIEAQVMATAAAGQPISVMMIDVDHFKAFNDLYGHLAGDACLKLVGQTVSGAVRSADVAARFGGEEFVAILPDASEEQAHNIAMRIQAALKECRIAHSGSPTGLVTASIGIAGYPAEQRTRSASQLLSRADEALYVAKDAGRDRIMGWRREFAGASVA